MKSQQKESPAPILQAQSLAKIEEFGELDVKVKAFAPTKDRHELLRKEIQSWYETAGAYKAFPVETDTGTLVVSEKSKERSISNMAGLAKLLGRSFFKLCSFSLKNLDDHVPFNVRKRFLTEAQTGARKVKWIPKGDEVAKAA